MHLLCREQEVPLSSPYFSLIFGKDRDASLLATALNGELKPLSAPFGRW
jgi:hypothetical protein